MKLSDTLNAYGSTIKIICLVCASLALIYIGHWMTDNHWSTKWSEREAQYAAAQVAANEAVRASERLWQSKLDKVSKDAKVIQERLQANAEQLAVVNDGLRNTVKVSTSKLQSAGVTIAELRRTNATSELVRRELLGYCLGRVESLATAFDRSRAAGLTCQSAYEAVRKG